MTEGPRQKQALRCQADNTVEVTVTPETPFRLTLSQRYRFGRHDFKKDGERVKAIITDAGNRYSWPLLEKVAGIRHSSRLVSKDDTHEDHKGVLEISADAELPLVVVVIEYSSYNPNDRRIGETSHWDTTVYRVTRG